MLFLFLLVAFFLSAPKLLLRVVLRARRGTGSLCALYSREDHFIRPRCINNVGGKETLRFSMKKQNDAESREVFSLYFARIRTGWEVFSGKM